MTVAAFIVCAAIGLYGFAEMVAVLLGPETMKPATHFVGFRGQEYLSALRVWGQPDFVHMGNDTRMRREVAAEDTVIYANGSEGRPAERNYSDLRPSDPDNGV